MYVGVYFYHTVDPVYMHSLLEIIFPQLTFILAYITLHLHLNVHL